MSPSLLNKVAQFARSPQGRRLAGQASRAARDPKTRRQIEQVRARLTKRGARGEPRDTRISPAHDRRRSHTAG
jgi:hypothetical protein